MNTKIHLNKWLTLLFVMTATPLLAAEWNAGGGTNTVWTNDSNWVGSEDPADTDVLFAAAGITNTTNPPSNVVDANISILSLTYQYTNATDYHTTEILSGVTLNVGGTSLDDVFLVGGITNTGTPIRNTSVVIKGEGTLNISQDGGSVTIANHRLADSPTGPYTASLDMRELATFSAYLGSAGSFNVGSSLPTNGPGGNQIASSTVYLASENSIAAGTLNIGSVIPNSQISIGYVPSSLYLGVSNELNVDVIRVGRGYASKATGYLGFDPSVLSESPEVVIRGLDGVSAVSEMKIGVNDGGGTSNAQEGEVDFSGGNVDALISSLIIGAGNNSGANITAYASGSLTMDQGIITASNVIVGSSRGANTASTNIGILNIEGGAFHATDLTLASRTASAQKASGTLNISGTGAVTVTNGIVMGSSAAGTDTLVATVNVDGGSLLVHGNIAEGSGSGIQSTLNLRGGNLNLGGNNITVDTFNVESGTLQNVGEFNAGADLVKTTAGTLTIAGTNTYSGSTIVSNGTLIGTATSVPGNIVNEGAVIFNQADNGAYSGVLSGSGTFKKDGAGTATFSGSSANTLSGDVTVSNGTLELAKTAGVASIAGDLTINSGAKLLVSTSNQVADTSNVTLSGGTIERASGVSEVFGDLNLTEDSFLDYGSGTKGTLTFGTYTPSSLLTVNNFFYGNMLVFSTDLSSTINDTDFFSFSSEFEYDWNGGASTFTITAVPEPSAYVTVVSLIGLMIWSLRRRTKCAR